LLPFLRLAPPRPRRLARHLAPSRQHHPIIDIAHDWVGGHLPEDATWWCGAVVVEHRFIGPIIGGAIGDGLVVR
jgi:hypothetical protein